MKVLVIDIGGNSVKILATGQKQPRKFPSGSRFSPRQMMDCVKKVAADWKYDAVSIGYPGVVADGKIVREPENLGHGWVGFDFKKAFRKPVKIINDAAMQALGSYKKGQMLFLGFGTGLGTAMVANGIVIPMELSQLPYLDGNCEDYVGHRGLDRFGKKEWRRHVTTVVKHLTYCLCAEDVVLGGGNVANLQKLPPKCRAGSNDNAFAGGFRLWEPAKKK